MKKKLKLTSFTQLKTWQEGHKLVLIIYKLTEKFPEKERFVLINQMLRAVISITSNIVEGFTRMGKKEKKHFYYTAKASLTELQNQLLIARDIGYLDKKKFNEIVGQTILVQKLLNSLIKGVDKIS